jgi:excisionase family DNA binding protein
MKLETRVFELYTDKYASLSKLSKAMGIATGQVYQVSQGKRPINHKFIVGAKRAFPEYTLDDLFYFVEDRSDAIATTTNGSGAIVKARRDEVVKLRNAGLTYSEIGRIMGVTKQRVAQIINGQPRKKPKPHLKAMLKISDVAHFLNVHTNTVRLWTNKGMLKAYHIGSRGDLRFRLEDIESFLKTNKVQQQRRQNNRTARSHVAL